MRRKGLWLSVLATAMIAGSASASTVTGISLTNSLFQNWGVSNPLTATNGGNWTPTQGDYVVGDGVTSPGGGGQDFDIEAVYSGFDTSNNTLYFTMVTGFNLFGEYSTVSPNHYYVGDVFFDFGSNGIYDLAFDLSELSPDTAGAIGTDTTIAVPVQLDAYVAPITSNNPPSGYPGSAPYRITNPAVNNNLVGFTYFRGGEPNTSTDHNVYNFAYQITNTDWLKELYQNTAVQNGGYTTHWTMSCGNDLLDLTVNPLPGSFTPVVPVPAAAPLGLLGMGLIALVRRVRRRTEC